MKANLRAIKQGVRDDSGVSPVIAVILMVAITVVLAATVYVWVSGFSTDDTGSENAQVRAVGFDSDGNGASDWIRLTLVRGENAPYGEVALDFILTAPDNTGITHDSSETTQAILCNEPDEDAAEAGTCVVADAFGNDADDEWDTGEALYVPCQDSGRHHLSLTIRNSVVLEDSIRCDEAAADGVS